MVGYFFFKSMASKKIMYFFWLMMVVYISKACGKELDILNDYADATNDNKILTSGLKSDIAFEADEGCFCGNNSLSCEIKDGLKVCTCKDGYIPGINEVCTEMCSESKPCENGGTCRFGLCACLPRTAGTFCEKVRLTCEPISKRGYLYDAYAKVRGLGCCCPYKANPPAKCKYDVKKMNAYCECPNRSDVFEDISNTCKECKCGKPETWTKCDFYGGVKTCFCKKNYEYNPKTKTCEYCSCGEHSTKCEFTWGGLIKCTCEKGYEQHKNQCLKCDCGENSFCKLRKGEAICHCKDNFQENNKTCIECNCGKHGKCVYDDKGKKVNCECDMGYSETSDGGCVFCYCGDNSVCTFDENDTKNCTCPAGYRDVNGFCNDIHECDEGITICPASEKCKNIPGGAFCTCADGYHKTNDGCTDIDECALESPCKNQGTECINKPGTYECKCKDGYLARGGNKNDLECQRNSAANIGYGLLASLLTIVVILLSIVIYKQYKR